MKTVLLVIGLVILCFFTNAQVTCSAREVDPRVKFLLEFMKDRTLAEERRLPIAARRSMSPPVANPVPADKMQLTKITADSIPVIIYKPDQPGKGLLPIVIEYHGGAFVYPLQPWMHGSGPALANLLNAIVIQVDYRVAPEHRFPAAVDDSYNAFKWIASNAIQWGGDTSRIMLYGASAGGNLAAVVSLLALKDGLGSKIKLQALFSAPLDNPYSNKYPAYKENANGYAITKNNALWVIENYTGDTLNSHAGDFRLYPLQADQKGMPPTLVFTTAFDLFRDEGAAYAEKLKKANVPVYHKCFAGQLHTMMGLPENAQEWKDMDEAIKAFAQKYL